MMFVACGKKKEKTGSVAAAIMRPEKASTTSLSLNTNSVGAAGTLLAGSTVQSFTPTSFKVPIYVVSLCKDATGGCYSIYRCSGSTDEECGVELSNIDAFELV